MDYELRPLTRQNLPDLVHIFKGAFGGEPPIKALKAKYNTDVFGCEPIGYIAYSLADQEPAAYYGMFPILLNYEGKRILAAQSGDTMTLPKHQGKGLFTQLARKTYETGTEKGIEFVFGFPNKNSMPGFSKKLDWKFEEDEMAFYKIKRIYLPFSMLAKVKSLAFIPSLMANVGLRICGFRRTKLFENSISDLDKNAKTISHDSVFVNYKKPQSPDYHWIEKGKFKAWIKITHSLFVGDVGYNPALTEKEFKAKIYGLMRATGCAVCFFSASKGTWLEQLFESSFKKEAGTPAGYLKLAGPSEGSGMQYVYADFDTF